MSLAEKNKDCIYGIRGNSPFSEILQIPDQIPFDYMHLILQGHTKWLINQYFFNKEKDCYIGKYFILIYIFLLLISIFLLQAIK